MSFALPESMREYIDSRVAAGNYGNTSEYIRDLVRRDQEEQARKRLRDLIEQGLASGAGRRRTKADDKELLAIARGENTGRTVTYTNIARGMKKIGDWAGTAATYDIPKADLKARDSDAWVVMLQASSGGKPGPVLAVVKSEGL